MVTLPGEKLVIRIWETVEKVGVGLCSPMQIRREGRARAEVRRQELLVDAQTSRDLDDIKSGRKALDPKGRLLPAPSNERQRVRNSLLVLPHDILSLIATARHQATLNTAEHILNMRRIAVYAEEEAERLGDDNISNKVVNPDWFARWREGAESITSEQLQRLWARVLAGEVKEPGSYAIRTLESLRALSQEDAELVALAAKYRIDSALVTTAREIFSEELLAEPNRLPLAKIIALQELGIVSGAEGGFLVTYNKSRAVIEPQERMTIRLSCNDKAIVVRSSDLNAQFALGGCLLTRTGREIMTLGTFTADLEYLKSVAFGIKASGNFQVSVGDRVPTSDGKSFTVANEIEI